MKLSYKLVLALLFVMESSHAKNNIKLEVVSDGHPVVGARVSVSTSDSTLEDVALTDLNGYAMFALNDSMNIKNKVLVVNAIGYKKQITPLTQDLPPVLKVELSVDSIQYKSTDFELIPRTKMDNEAELIPMEKKFHGAELIPKK